MYSTEQILTILKAKKDELKKKYPISEIALFGSYARGDYNEKSDIDILVDFDKSIGIEFISLAHDLSQNRFTFTKRNKTSLFALCGKKSNSCLKGISSFYCKTVRDAIQNIFDFTNELTFESYNADLKT